MKILFCNHHASAPAYGNPYRTYYMAKELVKLGHEVAIVTASFSHIRKTNPLESKTVSITFHEGIKYIILPTSKYYGSSIGRVRNIVEFLYSYYKNIKFITKEFEPDTIVEASTYILPFFISKKLSRKVKHASLVYEVRDLWPLSIIEIGGYSRFNPIIAIISAAQKSAINSSDLVISTLCKADAYFQKFVGSPSSFSHIQNGVDIDTYREHDSINSVTLDKIVDLKKQYSYIIGYTGSMGSANAVINLLKANALIDSSRIAIVLIGEGSNKEVLKKYCETHQMSNIFIYNSVSKIEIIKISSYFDLGFVGGKERAIHAYGVSPNKLFDYMMCKVPVLFCINSPDKIIEKANCGIVVKHPNPQEISLAINNFFRLEGWERNFMGSNGYNYVLENFTYSKLTKVLLESLTQREKLKSY